MESSPRRRKTVLLLAILAAAYWLAMFAATHLPIRTTPVGDPYSVDKLQHVSAFAALAALLSSLAAACGLSPWKSAIGVLSCVILYALFDEVSQLFVSRRQADILDWLADIAGGSLGIALFHAANRFVARREAKATPSSATDL
jgi:VanZ family protein